MSTSLSKLPSLLQWLPRTSQTFVLSENFLVVEQEKVGQCKSGASAPKPKALFDHQRQICKCAVMQKGPAVSCTFFRTFHSHCIPEAKERLDVHFLVYGIPLWNKFKLSIKENLQHNLAFALVQADFYATRKSAVSSFPTYHILLQAFVVSPRIRRSQRWQDPLWSDIMNFTNSWNQNIPRGIIHLKTARFRKMFEATITCRS
jgi:hypothetical protein